MPTFFLRHMCGYPAAAVVVALHVLIAVASGAPKSNTYDEIVYVTDGFSHWKYNDYRLNLAQGNLPQRWFALPLLTLDLKFPIAESAWRASDDWTVGDKFFFHSGNDLEKLLWLARCMNALLSAGLGLLVYGWSRRLFGPGGGMISLLAYAADPTVLANASLATSDLPTAAFFTASIACLWKMFHKLSPGSFTCNWLALAGLFLCKMSACLIVPMGLALLTLRLAKRCPMTIGRKGGVVIENRLAQAGVLVGVLMLQALLVTTTIWASYGFRYSVFHDPPTAQEHLYANWSEQLANTGALGRAIKFARDHYLLPEAYLLGTAVTYHGSKMRAAFLNGQCNMTGWWYFFPYTFLVKTPLWLFLLLIVAGAGAIVSWRELPLGGSRAIGRSAWKAFYATAPLWILLAVYWAAAIKTNLNIGHRHIMPVYPATFILAGAAGHWLGRRGPLGFVMPAAVAACLLALAGECAAMYPHYLAYFNRLAGSPRNGYKHLVNSSLDWGQDLPGLKRWLKEHDLEAVNGARVYLAYFGTADPAYYQIAATDLGSSKQDSVAPLGEGVYCISATSLQQVDWGPWCADYEQVYQETLKVIGGLDATQPAAGSQRSQLNRESSPSYYELYLDLRWRRLCAFLRQREPDDNVGYSILIYRLTAEDVQRAVFGPPVELYSPAAAAGDPNGTDGLASTRAQASCNLGASLARCGRLDEAIAQFQKALAINPGSVMIYNNLGTALATCGRFDEAIAQYQKALKIKPDCAESYNDLGAILTQFGRFDEAVVQIEKALEVKPDDVTAHYNLGIALADCGRVDEAITQYQKTLELKPDYAEAHNNLGNVLVSRGQIDEAIAHFQKALQLDPELVTARDNLGVARSQREEMLKALAERRESLRSRPDDIALLNDTAWVLATNPNASIRNGAEAIELAQRAVQLSDGREPAVLGTLAAAYAEAGRFAEAVKTAEQALALAASQNNAALAETLHARIKLYQAGSPYRNTQQPSPSPSGPP